MNNKSTAQIDEKAWKRVNINDTDYNSLESIESKHAYSNKSEIVTQYTDEYTGDGGFIDSLLNKDLFYENLVDKNTSNEHEYSGSIVILSIIWIFVAGFPIILSSVILGIDSVVTVGLILIWILVFIYISFIDVTLFENGGFSIIFLVFLGIVYWNIIISVASGIAALILRKYIRGCIKNRFLYELQLHNSFKIDPIVNLKSKVTNHLPQSTDIFGNVVHAGVGSVPTQKINPRADSIIQLINTYETDRDVVQKILTSDLENTLNRLQNLTVNEENIQIAELPENTETSVPIREGSVELMNMDHEKRAFSYVKSYGVSTIGGRSKVSIEKALAHVKSKNDQITDTSITKKDDLTLVDLTISKRIFEPDSDLIYEKAILELVTEVAPNDLPLNTNIHVRTSDGEFEAKYEVNQKIRNLITSDSSLSSDQVTDVSKNLELTAKAIGNKSLNVVENKLKGKRIKNLEVNLSRGTLFIDFSFDPDVVPSEEHTLVNQFDAEFFVRCVTYVPYISQFVGAECFAQDVLFRGITRSNDVIIKGSLSGETIDSCRSNMGEEDEYIDEISDSIENYLQDYETEEQKRERLFNSLQSDTYHHIIVNRIIPMGSTVEVLYTSKNAIERTKNENYIWNDMDPIVIPVLTEKIAFQVVISDMAQLASVIETELDPQWDLDEIKFVKHIEDIDKSYTFTVHPDWIREWTKNEEKKGGAADLLKKIRETFKPL